MARKRQSAQMELDFTGESLVTESPAEKFLDVSECTWSEGRFYQKNVYSLPVELRRYLLPENKDEGNFFYADFSVAELTLSAYMAGDTLLVKDIMEGRFWDTWLERYDFPKSSMKQAIYCLSYSASDNDFPADVQKTFSRDFTDRYSIWWNYIKFSASKFEGRKYPSTHYKNLVSGRVIPMPLPTEHHATFKFLNYRIQQSLSTYAQILFSTMVKDYGMKFYCLNFDSVWVTWKGKTVVDFQQALQATMDRLVSEGVLPHKMLFTTSEGENMAVAQGK